MSSIKNKINDSLEDTIKTSNEILRLGKFKDNVNDWKILKSRLDKELIWLVSSYVWYVWDSVHVRGADVRAEQFFGFLKFKYKELHIRSSILLENLQLLNWTIRNVVV